MYLIQTALVLLRLDLNPERRSCNVKFCNGSLEDVLLLECWSTLIKGPFTEIVFRLRGSLGLGGAIFSYPLWPPLDLPKNFWGSKLKIYSNILVNMWSHANFRVDIWPGKCAPRPKNSGAWALENPISSLIIPNFVYPNSQNCGKVISRVNIPNFVSLGAIFLGPRLTPR